MPEGKLAGFAERVLSPVTKLFSKIGSGILVVMILITVADVLGRKFFNLPVKGSFELGEMLLVIVVFFNLPNTEMQDGNVSIEILFIRFGQRTQKIIQSLMYILFLVISILLTWQLFVLALDEWSEGFTTTVLKIPTSPVIFLAALGCVLLSFVVLVRLLLLIRGDRK
jgi:TRAP-type C4-dicarboxylate transport system permease small subunit